MNPTQDYNTSQITMCITILRNYESTHLLFLPFNENQEKDKKIPKKLQFCFIFELSVEAKSE